MRLVAAAFSCALLVVGSTGVACASVAMDRQGFRIAIPGDWAEQAGVENATVAGFHASDANDTDVAFAWSSTDKRVVVIVQSMTSAAQVKPGAFRSNAIAMHNAIVESLGMTHANSSVNDDGVVVTGTAEGDLQTMHLVVLDKALVDSTRHLRGYSATCAIRAPVTAAARSRCSALLHSFKVTLDPLSMLPLETR